MFSTSATNEQTLNLPKQEKLYSKEWVTHKVEPKYIDQKKFVKITNIILTTSLFSVFVYLVLTNTLKLSVSHRDIGTGYDNYHKISACDHVRISEFCYMWHKWTNTKKASSDITGFT